VTADASAACTFYREVLQLEPLPSRELPAGRRQHAFCFGRQRIKLLELPQAPPRQPSGLYDGNGYRVLGLLTADLDSICERVEARGRRVSKGIDLPGRLRIRFAKDADGNMLELIGLEDVSGDALTDPVQVGLTVSNIESARHFYGEVLGLPEQPQISMGDGMTRYAYSIGSSTLKFWTRGPGLPNLGGSPGHAVGIRYVTLKVRDLDAVAARVDAAGAKLVGAPKQLPGRRMLFVEDPDGSWIELSEPGGAPPPR
jgi:catechol 2,3-dioxygenase-like lactoylglutathione lyase family enzyme